MSVRAADMEQAKCEAEVHVQRLDAAQRDIVTNFLRFLTKWCCDYCRSGAGKARG